MSEALRPTPAPYGARPTLAVVALAFLITVLSCPVIGFGPAPGFDVSWSGGLHMAITEGLVFGRDIVFTYGPLGFLQIPSMWDVETGLLAIAYLFVSRTALAVVLFLALRRSFGPWWAALGTYVLLLTTNLLAVPLAVLLAGMMLLSSDAPQEALRRRARIFAVVAGVLSGAEMLAKFNVGVLLALTAGIVVLAGPDRRRNAPLIAVCGAVSLLVLWVVTGQPLSAVPDYFVNSLRITAGYTDALLLDDPTGRGEITVALVLSGLGVAAAAWTGRGPERDARIGLAVLWAAFAYVQFKSGFIRQDASHVAGFFGPLAIGLAGFPWHRESRRAGAVAIAFAAAFAISSLNLSVGQLLSPGDRIGIAGHAEQVLLHQPSRRQAKLFGRAQIQAADRLSPPVLGAVRGHRVHVWPSEIAVAWAYGLDWRPLPTMQSNLAYTPGLDGMNDRRLLAPDGPDRILLNGNTYAPTDTRLASWDQPRTARSLLCHFRPVSSSATWLALARGPSRCGAERLVGSVRVPFNAKVTVPPPSSRGRLVVARIAGLKPSSLFERARGIVYKGRRRVLTTERGIVYRLTPAIAGYGLVLRSARGVDYDTPFNQVPQILLFKLGGSGLDPSDRTARVRVDFYEMDVRPLT